MTEHQRETAFLKQLILFDDTDGRRKLDEGIAEIQRDERCVRRAAWLMALFAVLAVAGLGYGAVLQKNFFYGTFRFVIELVCALGLASLICLVAFAGLLAVYRRKLNRLREECRRLVTKLLESRLGKPHSAPLRDSHLGAGNRGVAKGAAETNGSPERPGSLREGMVHGVKPSPQKIPAFE